MSRGIWEHSFSVGDEFVTREFTPAQTFRAEEVIDRHALRHGGEEYLRFVHRALIRNLADELMKHCKPVKEADMHGDRMAIEVTINDYGTYKYMTEDARRNGIKAGRQQAIEAEPYGVEQGQFYE